MIYSEMLRLKANFSRFKTIQQNRINKYFHAFEILLKLSFKNTNNFTELMSQVSNHLTPEF